MKALNHTIAVFVAVLGVFLTGCPEVCEEFPLTICDAFPAAESAAADAQSGRVDYVADDPAPSAELLPEDDEAAAAADQTAPASPELVGDADESAAAAVPEMDYEPREEDFSEDHPELPGFPISFNTLLLVFTLDTTVGQANAVLTEIEAEVVGGLPGVAEQVEGILALRVPITSHDEMTALIENLRQNERVKYVAQDTLLSTQAVPDLAGETAGEWSWEVTPTRGNWGMELLRVPAMWNLNQFVARSGRIAVTAIIDRGFTPHDDLTYTPNLTAPIGSGDHGTRVAGVIGAKFDNDKGIDGVNPYSKLIAKPIGNFGFSASAGHVMFTGLEELMDADENADADDKIIVINVSLGYRWAQYPGAIDETGNLRFPWQATANHHGGMVATLMNNLAIGGSLLPFVVVSAGDDSGLDALYNSPFTNAALGYDRKNIIVVESLEQSDDSPGGAKLSLSSNDSGHVSAPGVEILTTAGSPFPLPYVYESGTSFAAPHVAGLIGYLYAADPNLPRPSTNVNQVLELLQKNGVAVADGASDRIDAYAAVLSLDEAVLPTPSSAPIRHALLDVTATGAGALPPPTNLIFDEFDIQLFLSKFLDANGQPLQNGTEDWSRYDLNGDGFTGGTKSAKFDLDRVNSVRYGAPAYADADNKITQVGLTKKFDEENVTDLDCLCYYAYSGLYQGDPDVRSNLLGTLCDELPPPVPPIVISDNRRADIFADVVVSFPTGPALDSDRKQKENDRSNFDFNDRVAALLPNRGAANAEQNSSVVFNPSAPTLITATGNGSADATAQSGGLQEPGTLSDARSDSRFRLTFSISPGESYQYTATGSLTLNGKRASAEYTSPLRQEPTKDLDLQGEEGGVPIVTQIGDSLLLGPGNYSIEVKVSARNFEVFGRDLEPHDEASFRFNITLQRVSQPVGNS